jgi:predicted  nucleic acid-binding Zn-ribbon protein
LVTFLVHFKSIIQSKHIIEGKIRGTRRRGRRRKQLLDDIKEARRYWKLKEELRIALFGDIRLEDAMDLSQDRLLDT